jgi:membrane fusion protein (multidrug efflux system)
VHSQEIKIKGEIPDLYVIESGLTANDKILRRYSKVKENDKIKYKSVDATYVITHLKSGIS